ncbi:MAG: ferrochelatase [Actinomycetia bacterium]|nr:ferrochelatase [Actinomycetes bacterium]
MPDSQTHTAPTSSPAPDLAPYEAIVLLSFGGPEGPEEVLPFLRRVTAGKNIPDERLVEVGQHYALFGGVSPINAQNRALIAALETELAERGQASKIWFGNRNSEPLMAETFTALAEAGHRRILAITTSAYSSYSSCRQYRENIADAVAECAERTGITLEVDKLRPYALHPGFAEANLAALTAALREAVAAAGADQGPPALLFVTHSIPTAMDETSGPGDGEGHLYSRQHLWLAEELTERAAAELGLPDLSSELVFCSRSGPPSQPWLEPDVNDRLEELAAAGTTHVVLAPIGFISDHMEVIYDLDTEAQASAERLGLHLTRAATAGTEPAFVTGLVDLIVERAAEARGERPVPIQWTGDDVRPAVCEPGCCPNLRTDRPALCGRD